MLRLLIQTALVAVISFSAATSAFAADVFGEALALTDGQSRAISQSRYVKLSEGLDMAKAKAIDAAITAKYGAPEIQRSGLKVWEVKNPDGPLNSAEIVTITCGVENGRVQISIDARVPDEAPAPLKKALTPVPVAVQFRASKSSIAPAAPQSGDRLELRPESSDR